MPMPSRATVCLSLQIKKEDYVNGDISCPGCGSLFLVGGGCNVLTCISQACKAAHGGSFFYFCAHCKAECPDGESLCTNCPSRSNRKTRLQVAAQRERELKENSADNPFVLE